MSRVLKTMLDASGIEPSSLEPHTTPRIPGRVPNVGSLDKVSRQPALATGAVVTRLRRKNRYLLTELESRGFSYRERNARARSAVAPGALPETVQATGRDRRLEKVVGLGPSRHRRSDRARP